MIIEVKSSDYTIQQAFDAACSNCVLFLLNCPREISICRITHQKHSSEICHFQRNLNANVRRGVEERSSRRESLFAHFYYLLPSAAVSF